MCGLWDCNRNKIHFLQRIWLTALCCSHYLLIFCIHVHLYFLPFLSCSMGFLSTNLFWWRSGRSHVTGYVTFLTRPLLSIPYGNSKSVTHCNSSFGEVLGYMQEGMSRNESESERTIASYHNTKMLLSCNKTKKFAHWRFLLKQTFWQLLHVLY